jgi:AcrR family transcriptional regulator
VVEAATRLFAEEGYEGVTMRSLASELGCSPMTPYRYFRNKEALFAEIRTEAFRRFADRQAIAARAPRPRQALLQLGRAYVQFALDEPNSYRIMFELQRAPKRRYPDLEAQQRRAFSYLYRAVKASRPGGDALTLAHFHWAQVHGIVSLHLAGKLIMGRDLDVLCRAMFSSESSSMKTSRKRRTS